MEMEMVQNSFPAETKVTIAVGTTKKIEACDGFFADNVLVLKSIVRQVVDIEVPEIK